MRNDREIVYSFTQSRLAVNLCLVEWLIEDVNYRETFISKENEKIIKEDIEHILKDMSRSMRELDDLRNKYSLIHSFRDIKKRLQELENKSTADKIDLLIEIKNKIYKYNQEVDLSIENLLLKHPNYFDNMNLMFEQWFKTKQYVCLLKYEFEQVQESLSENEALSVLGKILI